MTKTYNYQIFRNGVYLGLLTKVISDFNYRQNINSAGVQLDIILGLSADTSLSGIETIQDETGADITDELSNPLYIERPLDIVGNDSDNILIRNNNDIKVYEISDSNPTGLLVFTGYIESYIAVFGGKDNIKITCLSYGQELQDYIIKTGLILDASQTNQNTTFLINSSVVAPQMGQAIYPGAGVTDVSGVTIKLAAVTTNNPLVTMSLYASNSGAQSLARALSGAPADATGTNLITSTSPVDYNFILGYSFSSVPDYYVILISCIDSSGVNIYLYSDTSMKGQESFTTGVIGIAGIYYKTYHSSPDTIVVYTGQDPTAILRDIIDSYSVRGGVINYASGTTDLTGLNVDYTFKLQTISEGIIKCLQLAPFDWYWYVNPATQILYFKQTPVTATHTFIKGRHINELELSASVENVKNELYFSGGLDGVTNLFTIYENTASQITQGHIRLNRISDNRVTLQATADAIGESYLDENSDENYQTSLIILDGTYNISLINPGDTISFGGFNNFIDRLILQVASLKRLPDSIELVIGELPPRQSAKLQQVIDDIDKLQTIDNPNTPI